MTMFEKGAHSCEVVIVMQELSKIGFALRASPSHLFESIGWMIQYNTEVIGRWEFEIKEG